jgi:hypothetical protein
MCCSATTRELGLEALAGILASTYALDEVYGKCVTRSICDASLLLLAAASQGGAMQSGFGHSLRTQRITSFFDEEVMRGWRCVGSAQSQHRWRGCRTA